MDLRTPAFIGLLITHIGNNWGSFIISTEIPTYLNNIQHVSLKEVSEKTRTSEAVFLVSLRMSSFPVRHELQREIIEKLVPI
jgi:hypothetical protein